MVGQGLGSAGVGGRKRAGMRGFTLMEAICVLLVIGIMAIFVGVHLSSNSKAVAEADALKAALRFAQSRAMADVYTWGIRFSSSGYTLVENNPNVATVLPGQGSASRNMPAGVNITTSNLTGNTIYFDWRGQPVTAAITAIGGASTPATNVQTVRVTESNTVTINVTPYTGFIP